MTATKAAGQMVGFCNFCLARFLFLSLALHDPRALQAKLYLRRRMNRIIDIAVAGDKAT